MTLRDRGTSSRRDLLSLGAAGAMGFLGRPGVAFGAERDPERDPERNHGAIPDSLNVKTFGSKGDATSDDTAAFQRALDAAYKAGGGAVYVPPGRYLFKGTLTIPDGVGLRGSFGCVSSHSGIRDHGQPKPGDDGSALFVTAGRGNEEGKPFLTLNTNSSVSGLTVYYPEQVVDENPVPYPWTIAMRGKNPAAFDLELLNPYQGIDASQNERHNIRNITGQPLRRGIWVDAIYDIGRIENVHFNPWWNSHSKVYRWQTTNGEAFIFGRADWEYVLNTFCFGYRVGYKFVETATGACNGNFLGIGADDCNRAMQVEQSAPYGILIANGEFTSFHGDDPTMLEVSNTNTGVVRISNSAFWGPCNQIAKVSGQGTVGFSDCTFVQWSNTGDRAAIQAYSGSLLIRGCEFRQRKRHISLGQSVERAVITGNLFEGPALIENTSTMDIQIGLNAASR
ncbi:glycosyl hydrolase family 28-related protein [Terracidiphilus gabretensis]|uniref:glycosyl hydrolase family 28-related protein n=1 Tax=Terracidiphilus gabretensis TaxID=1577687 RepID=UPI000AA8BA7B|nr:glycosyl hydrolase family 28-related protein [Terracidiphilus gabretensis]